MDRGPKKKTRKKHNFFFNKQVRVALLLTLFLVGEHEARGFNVVHGRGEMLSDMRSALDGNFNFLQFC